MERWTCTRGDLCICMAYGFEKSKVRMVRQKNKIIIKNKDVGLVTTHRLGIVNETY